MNKKNFIFISSILATLVFVYLLIRPIFYTGITPVLFPKYVKNLSSARNYYQVLSSISAIIFSLVGTVLGYFYYIHKIKTDEENAVRGRKRIRIEMLIGELKNYDDLVIEFFFSAKDIDVLRKIREKIIRSGDNITSLLTFGDTLFGFEDDEVKKIIRIHSFIEQNELSMGDENLESKVFDKNKYFEILQDARLVCLNKLE